MVPLVSQEVGKLTAMLGHRRGQVPELILDGVDLVIAVGLPNSASSYLHVAGRTGRRLGEEVAEGTVVTVIHPKAVASLESWANQLGQVVFEELVT